MIQPIRVAVLQDLMGTSFATPEEEVEQILEELKSIFRRPVNLLIADRNFTKVAETNPELVVVDYGGMAIYGASSAAEWQVRAVRTWAEEHPSGVVCIWSGYTEEIYKEVSELLPELPNVVVRFSNAYSHEEKLLSYFSLSSEEIEKLPETERCKNCYHERKDHTRGAWVCKARKQCTCERFVEQSLSDSEVGMGTLQDPTEDSKDELFIPDSN